MNKTPPCPYHTGPCNMERYSDFDFYGWRCRTDETYPWLKWQTCAECEWYDHAWTHATQFEGNDCVLCLGWVCGKHANGDRSDDWVCQPCHNANLRLWKTDDCV